MKSIFRPFFKKNTPDTGETVVNPLLNPIHSKYYISDYDKGTYTIDDSKISYDDTNAYYLCSTWYPTIVYKTQYVSSGKSIPLLKLYHVFIINPTTTNDTSDLKLNYNLTTSLKNNYQNKTSDSIDVTKLSVKSIEILNIINDYDNMIDTNRMMNNTKSVADITYTQDELNILAHIRDLIVKGEILLRASEENTSTTKCIYYMESPAKDEKKGGKHTRRRTSRRACKSKKSIRKSKLRRRHRK